MKLVIFSTDTKHHRYFINKIAKKFDICSIVYERKKITNLFYENHIYSAKIRLRPTYLVLFQENCKNLQKTDIYLEYLNKNIKIVMYYFLFSSYF